MFNCTVPGAITAIFGQDSNQERATRLTPTRVLHWHLNSERFDVHLPYLIYDPTIAKDP
jgi:hypothetical protein